MTAGRISRRTLVGTAAAGAAGAALPGSAGAATRRPAKPKRRAADVIVVGAGLAGIAAAREIVRAGRSVIVMEARPRVGGRILNQDIGGGKVLEIGGQWVGPTQDHMLALAADVGVDTYKTYNEGDNLYYRNGTLLRFSSSGPLGPVPPDPTGGAEAQAAIVQLNSMASETPRDAPWTAPSANDWDGQTFETFKRANAQSENGRFLLDVGIEAVFAAEPRDVSLLFVVQYIAQAGNDANPGTFERLINTAGGAQESRFAGGSQLVALKAAQQLGRRVLLGAPARRIFQSRRGVRVESDKLSATGKRCIVTVPPALAGRIEYKPLLPAIRDQYTQRVPMGSVIKCMAVYDRPFWRDEGLTGQVVSDADPVRITFDNTPADGSPGVLLGFIEGAAARDYSRRNQAEVRDAVLRNFATYFGERARQPTAFYALNWATEPWSRGCYEGYLPPGVLLDYGGAIRQAVGRIHWAGTETATWWNGYMDGAVQSGQRAAREALAEL